MDQIIIPLIFAVIGISIGAWQASQGWKAREQTLKDRGARGPISLGICLSGLPGLDGPAPVSCGDTATELIFLADADNREICRLPWSSIGDIFGGSEDETHLRLSGTDALPSLILAQSDHLRPDGRHHYIPSYTVIDWTDSASQRRQAVFELRGQRMGDIQARVLSGMKTVASHRA
jgi:hypothetical protein